MESSNQLSLMDEASSLGGHTFVVIFVTASEVSHSCPVHQSLHPDVELVLEFVWG